MSSVLRRGPEFGPAPKPPVFSFHTVPQIFITADLNHHGVDTLKAMTQEWNIVHAWVFIFACRCKFDMQLLVVQYLCTRLHICIQCVCVFVCARPLQRAHRNIFPLLSGAAVLLSRSRSRAGHCICVLCVTSCVRLWIVSETMVCFALKGHLNHFALGCKCRRIQRCCFETICIFPPVCCHLNAAWASSPRNES